jgi:hypothetical protein
MSVSLKNFIFLHLKRILCDFVWKEWARERKNHHKNAEMCGVRETKLKMILYNSGWDGKSGYFLICDNFIIHRVGLFSMINFFLLRYKAWQEINLFKLDFTTIFQLSRMWKKFWSSPAYIFPHNTLHKQANKRGGGKKHKAQQIIRVEEMNVELLCNILLI